MIPRKLKTCISCQQSKYIFGHKLCFECYRKNQANKTSLPQPKKQIAKFSKKHLSNLRDYRKVRDIYLKENPICQYPKCGQIATDLHHGAGRIGSLLTDPKYFKSLCRPHHQLIETSPDLARKLGLSFSRLNQEHDT